MYISTSYPFFLISKTASMSNATVNLRGQYFRSECD
jgi:hypothetical protein